ncbi:hypothetical protein [Microbacterium sp. ru370.1]|nr:hypothetical protein [Microbacterium sp. ru370.1]
MSMMLMTGCASLNYDLSAQDAVGSWSAGGDSPLRLDVRADGTFQATGWPSNAWCEGRSTPRTVNDLRIDETRSFSGTWTFVESSGPDSIRFTREDGDDCSVGTAADFWEEGGITYACFPLPGVTVDAKGVENLIVIYRDEPIEPSRADSCFNYN